MGYLNLPDQYKEILGMTADDYAKKQTSALSQQGQQYLADYEKIAEQRKNALNTSKQNAVQQIQQQIPEIEGQAKEQSRQAYINNMLSQKDMGQKLSQAGLSTTGVVGSAYGDLANAYGENVNKIGMDKANALRGINNQVNNANLQFVQQEQELLADIESTKMDMNKYNNENTFKQYQQAIDNYMKFKSIEEYVNGYNQQQDQFKAQQEQNAFQNRLAEQEIALKRQEAAFNRQQQSKSGNGALSFGGDGAGNEKKENEPTYAQRAAEYLIQSNAKLSKEALYKNAFASRLNESEKDEIAELLRKRGNLIE